MIAWRHTQYIYTRKNYKPFESLGFGWLVAILMDKREEIFIMRDKKYQVFVSSTFED